MKGVREDRGGADNAALQLASLSGRSHCVKTGTSVRVKNEVKKAW